LEETDKDRTVPWVTYESRLVIGVHFLTKPSNTENVLVPSNYKIYSAQDSMYGAPTSPISVSYRSRVIFGALRASANYLQQVRFGHHAFLRLPSSLHDGATYTVNVSASPFGTATSFTLRVNETTQLNTNIRVSQVGYLLSGPKIAFVGAWLGSATASTPIVHVALDLPDGNATQFTVEDAVNRSVAFQGVAQFVTPTSNSENPGGLNNTDL
ncbi:hypothetical protein Vretifemale_8212, partial [Volvox reticuliferus]